MADQIVIDIKANDQASAKIKGMGLNVIALNQALELGRKAWDLFSRGALEVIQTSDKFRRYDILLQQVTGSAQGAARAMDDLRKIAKQSPLTLDAMTNAFVKLKSSGLDEAQRTMVALSDAVAAFGGTEQEFNRAVIAIQQMSGKGVISMEELRQQLGEAVPTATRIMAREMGMSMREFTDQVSKGAIDAQEGIAAMTRGFEKDFKGASGRMMDTWSGAVSNMQDAWDQLMTAIGKAGVLEAAITIVQGLTEAINNLTGALNGLEGAWSKLGRTTLAWLLSDSVANFKVRLDALKPAVETAMKLFGDEFGGMASDGGPVSKTNEQVEKVTDSLLTMSSVLFDSRTWGLIEDTRTLKEQAELAADEYERIAAAVALLAGDSTITPPPLPSKFAGFSDVLTQSAQRLGGGVAGVGGAIQGAQMGGPLGAVAGFFTDLLMRNDKMRDMMKRLSEILVDLVGPIADALAPALKALAPVIQKLAPVFRVIGFVLEKSLGPLVMQIEALGHFIDNLGVPFRFLQKSIEDLTSPLESLRRIIEDLRDALDNPGKFFGGGGGGGGGFGNPGGIFGGGGGGFDFNPVTPFHSGGLLTQNGMMRLPGMAPDEGLFLGQVGEEVVPKNRAGTGAGGPVINFNIRAIEPDAVARELRQLLEELSATGRLRTA